MRTKYPIEYELNPTKIDLGTHWLTLKLKNIGSETLKELDVELHYSPRYIIIINYLELASVVKDNPSFQLVIERNAMLCGHMGIIGTCSGFVICRKTIRK